MTPLAILGLLGFCNIVILVVYVYTHNTIRKLASFIDAFVVTTSVREDKNMHEDILRTATEQDVPLCVNLIGSLLMVPQTLYFTMMALAIFWWTLSAGNFFPIVAIITAGLQAYCGLLLFRLGESLYTAAALERKYTDLETRIFDDEE